MQLFGVIFIVEKYASSRQSRTLHISTLQNEPFMRPNDSGDLKKGIEFELIKIIAEKEDLKLFSKTRLQ